MLDWYALRVRTRSEPLAALALANRGFESFSPLYQERRRYSDRIKTVAAAAFPGYVFCRFNARLKESVLNSPAVQDVVGIAGVPTPIEGSEMETIRRVVAAGAQSVPYLKTGQQIRIEYGPLRGIEGILTRDQSGQRLTVSVDLLQRSIAVAINADQVGVL